MAMKLKLSNAFDWFGFGQESVRPGRQNHGNVETHGHTHGVIDASIASTDRGIWAIKWSFLILGATAAFQIAIVVVSGSVALLADTIHNIADATTAIPLWIAFQLARRKPSDTFTYGYGRVEDLAGISIVAIILFSAIVAGYEAVQRILDPQPIGALIWVALAGLIGFIGNEAVAVFRIRVGREINSAALIADGYHARTDGLTSLAVVIGAAGVWLGFPSADPIVGLLITAAIFVIVWQSARSVLTRMLDGVEPGLVDEVRHAAAHVKGISKVIDVRARWLGHKLHVDAVVLIDPKASLAEADTVSQALKSELFAHVPALTVANVRVHGSAEAASPLPHSRGHAGQHNAPDPFAFEGKLAAGLLEIVDTPVGERVRMSLSRHAGGLKATIVIKRARNVEERLPLAPDTPDHHHLVSSVAPAEPHSFAAEILLHAGTESEVIPFRMEEPEGHTH
ncbi:MAG: cation transporter [Proteobacteria bacterium]|nr:cation transporter [Pseudomonadota bacterium]